MTDRRDRLEPGLSKGALEQLLRQARANAQATSTTTAAPAATSPPAPPSAPAAPAPAAGAHRGWWLAGLTLVLGTLVALVLWREPLGELLVPESPITRQLAAAQQALARGQLTRADGQGARELYQAALAIDSDHPAARAGLAQVRDAALAKAEQAITAGDAAAARQALTLATELSAPVSALEPLQARLQALDASAGDIEQTLAQAQTDLQQGRDDAALAAYQRVLQQHPGNALALEGRRTVLAEWLVQARRVLEAGDLAGAESRVLRVLEIDPSHLDLPAVQARLGEVRASRERERTRALEQAERALKADDLDAAWSGFQALLAREPEWAPAREGSRRTLDTVADQVRRDSAEFEFERAEAGLQRLRSWAPKYPPLPTLQAQLQRARAAQGRLPVDAGDRARLPGLLGKAAAAIDAGRLIEPPGANAWDLLRAAVAIAPEDAAVNEALRRFDIAARQCFDRHALANRLSDAEACLDARSLREPPRALADARRRLALRWLALGNERLGQNEPELAQTALNNARRLDARAPGVRDLEDRLRQVWDAGRR